LKRILKFLASKTSLYGSLNLDMKTATVFKRQINLLALSVQNSETHTEYLWL